jgi:hypothetical protein
MWKNLVNTLEASILGQKVSFDDLKLKFEYGSLGIKN